MFNLCFSYIDSEVTAYNIYCSFLIDCAVETVLKNGPEVVAHKPKKIWRNRLRTRQFFTDVLRQIKDSKPHGNHLKQESAKCSQEITWHLRLMQYQMASERQQNSGKSE